MKSFVITVTACLVWYAAGKSTTLNCNCHCPGGIINPTRSTVTCPLNDITESRNAPEDHTHDLKDHTHDLKDHTHDTKDHNHDTKDHIRSAKDEKHIIADLIAFSVGSSNAFAPGTFTRIPMEVILYNDGKYFHADNAFHAPVKGLYAFTFSGVAIHGKKADLTLHTDVRNGTIVNVARAVDYAPSGSTGCASASVMLKLDVGQTVSVWLGEIYPTTGHLSGSSTPITLFSGELKRRLD